MSNLTKLVPPIKMCKVIPKGELADSEFVHSVTTYRYYEGDIAYCETVCARGSAYLQCTSYTTSQNIYPAPTLQEVMDVLPQGVELSKDSGYFCSLDMSNEYYCETAVIAALKVWLELKGIEDEE